jgi:uncharacterized membrane protein
MNYSVNKLSLLLGLLVLSSVIFAGGKASIDFFTWPPTIIFPETSLLWRMTLGCAGIYCIVFSFSKKAEK